jgi:hypothetical protein
MVAATNLPRFWAAGLFSNLSKYAKNPETKMKLSSRAILKFMIGFMASRPNNDYVVDETSSYFLFESDIPDVKDRLLNHGILPLWAAVYDRFRKCNTVDSDDDDEEDREEMKRIAKCGKVVLRRLVE